VTPEVYAEVVVIGAGLPGAQETSNASWIEVQQIAQSADLSAAQIRFALDIGEVSVLVLAKEIHADLILIDDLEARKMARSEGLRVQRTVGVLEASFSRGDLADLRQAFKNLLDRGVYLDRAFLRARLEALKLPPLG
jgi:uncharacterized protein